MTTGVLLDHAFRLYTGNFALMLGIAAAAYVPFYLIMLVIESSIGVALKTRGPSISMLVSYLVILILWAAVVIPIATGASTFAISERYLGNEVTIGEALRRGLRRFLALSIAQLTASIRIMFGFLLFIVPGILWLLSYSLTVPVILIEGQKGMSSLRRSRELIKGFRGKAFCTLLIVYLLQFVLTRGILMIAGFFFSGETGAESILGSAMNSLLSIFFAPLAIIATILLYYDMRIRKEGFDLEMLSRAIAPEVRPTVAVQTPIR